MKSETYEEFVEKFKPKKTTDDCYTPPEIYEVIRDWACKEYGIDPNKIVRPFWPGGDYEHYDYPDGCVVIDNPPFSILSRICEFYLERGIPFFLFAPSLTALSSAKTAVRMCHIICDASIVYDNGAVVKTSFVTSYDDGIIARTGVELTREIGRVSAELRARTVKQFPKYEYPHHVLTAAMLQKLARFGVDFQVRSGECTHVRVLDSQKLHGKGIYGSGLLLSDAKAKDHAAAERAAAERAAAERAAAERANVYTWQLSDREKNIIAGLE
ncbi:MAG: hypothetical protein KH449_04390 [Lachnospiraceae bacterium]|nr:hypothetical protein [Lachnospiraceae bacterium]